MKIGLPNLEDEWAIPDEYIDNDVMSAIDVIRSGRARLFSDLCYEGLVFGALSLHLED